MCILQRVAQTLSRAGERREPSSKASRGARPRPHLCPPPLPALSSHTVVYRSLPALAAPSVPPAVAPKDWQCRNGGFLRGRLPILL